MIHYDIIVEGEGSEATKAIFMGSAFHVKVLLYNSNEVNF